MLAAGLDAISVAKKLPATPQAVRRWMKDKEPHMSAVHLIEVCRLLNVRAHWLATGEGSPSRFNATEYTEAEMLESFRALGPEERRLMRDIVGVILKYREG
jgi:hypothetical protein